MQILVGFKLPTEPKNNIRLAGFVARGHALTHLDGFFCKMALHFRANFHLDPSLVWGTKQFKIFTISRKFKMTALPK